MPELTKDRDTLKRGAVVLHYPAAAGAMIYAGALVVLEAGYAKPGAAGAGLIAVGRANKRVDNTGGGAGDVSVPVERGLFRWANAGDVTQAHVGTRAYIVDDQTVSSDDDEGGRSEAGIIRGVESGGVWVEI